MSYYSITFGTTSTKNTWTNWKLVPESPPVIPPPKPKTNFVDIPGRVKGPLDLSRVPFGHLTYERITGSWMFIVYEDYWTKANPLSKYNTVRSWLHGRTTKIVLEEDSTHYYKGMFTVEAPNRGQGPFAIRINYDLEPVRYNVSDDSIDTSWVQS